MPATWSSAGPAAAAGPPASRSASRGYGAATAATPSGPGGPSTWKCPSSSRGSERRAPLAPRGVVAAGHPLTARAGADVLRAGGNAVDAAIGAMLTSFVAEPLLTGLGAGGYMLVAPPGGEPVLLDFFVESPGRGFDASQRAPLLPVEVSFGDAVQVFKVGPSSCGV